MKKDKEEVCEVKKHPIRDVASFIVGVFRAITCIPLLFHKEGRERFKCAFTQRDVGSFAHMPHQNHNFMDAGQVALQRCLKTTGNIREKSAKEMEKIMDEADMSEKEKAKAKKWTLKSVVRWTVVNYIISIPVSILAIFCIYQVSKSFTNVGPIEKTVSDGVFLQEVLPNLTNDEIESVQISSDYVKVIVCAKLTERVNDAAKLSDLKNTHFFIYYADRVYHNSKHADLKPRWYKTSIDTETKQEIRNYIDSRGLRGKQETITPSWLSKNWIYMLILGLVLFFVIGQWRERRKAKVAAGKYDKHTDNPAKLVKPEDIDITFKDVIGVEGAKKKLKRVQSFLQHPEKYEGIKFPKGYLLNGPPGTGKTMIVKALAKKAGVPVYTLSGSCFTEMFVGVGPARIRNMIEVLKKNAPCILFIDEADAVGQNRAGSSNDEDRKTLNELFGAMDGMNDNGKIIWIAATNLIEILDPGFLRPGRFTYHIYVGPPNLKNRIKLLKHYMNKIGEEKFGPINIEKFARGIPGVTGAGIDAIVNDSRILSLEQNLDRVDEVCLRKAKEVILAGEESDDEMDPETEHKIAVHEAGHASLGACLEHADPLVLVDIVPRGSAGGITWFGENDVKLKDRGQIVHGLAVCYGGRVSEEIFLNHITPGAMQDIKQATDDIVIKVVASGLFSDKLAPLNYTHTKIQELLPEQTKLLLGNEIQNISREAYALARSTLEKNRDNVLDLVNRLKKRKTIEGEEVYAMFGKEPKY